jgi:glycosyltransferase involved in cell wall biosynthesis
MKSPVACTIVANNYLAYARVFSRSFLEQHPDGKVFVLIVDRPHPGLRYEDEPFETVFAEDLGIPGFPHYAFRYSILELNTAVKPWFLLHLHRKLGCDRLCYFDPDIQVLGDLSPIYDRLGEVDALLTPHITAPIDDGLIPGERDFLLSGVYNLGFLGIACNERTLPFLAWWHRRLYRECLHAVERGLFVDQRWMDFAPSFLAKTEVRRDPGSNVAYWNLMHRSLERRDGRWWVGDAPVRFFHFSGYMLDRQELISKYQNRFSLSQRLDVQPLFREYGERLTAEGHLELQAIPYRYGLFDNGTPVPGAARRLLQTLDPEGSRWSDPFSTSGPDSFLGWLQSPDDRRATVCLPRIALVIWEQRPDLQQVFPSPDRKNRLSFAEWFISHAAENQVGPSFTKPVEESLHRLHRLASSRSVEIHDQVWHELSRGVRLEESRFTPDDIAALAAECGPEPGCRPRIPRVALMLHRQRTDLQTGFPDPFGTDRKAFALWFVTSGRMEYDLPAAFVRPVLRSLAPRTAAWALLWYQRQRWRRRSRPVPSTQPASSSSVPSAAAPDRLPVRPLPSMDPHGLNVIGWAAAPTGVGEACRTTLRALEQAGLPHALWSLGASAGDDARSGAAGGMGGQGLPYEVNLYHVNADMMEIVTRQLPLPAVAGRHRIGYWFWELSHFPLFFANAFRYVDEVWAPSRFCQEAYRALAPVEVRWVPPAVIPPEEPPADRSALGVPPESFLFFFAFDALSIPERKNPVGLIEALARVVRESPRPVHLLLKVNHLEAEPSLEDLLRRMTAGLPVTLLAQPMSRSEMNSLTSCCDAYASLHRSEGLGLPLIESMYLGKPVIATGYGGVTDFLDETTGWVVRHELTTLEMSRGPYPAGAVWAQPDVDHAAELMLEVANAAPRATAGRIEAARRRVVEIYAPAAAGARLRRELKRIERLRNPRKAEEASWPGSSDPGEPASASPARDAYLK